MSGEENYRLYLDGDDEGLVSIIKEYRDPLTLYLAGVAGSFSLAEEFAEETFFILAAKRPRFNGKSSFKTWLYAIAKNTALKAAWKTSREVALTDDEAAEESLEDAVISDERRRTVRRALGRVSKDYCEALYLVYIEQMPNGDAAKVMKKSKRQIENLLYRAKSALRRELEKEGFTYEDL